MEEEEQEEMIDAIIYHAFMRHISQLHNADYEVCPDWVCRIAYWIEIVFTGEWRNGQE